MCQWKMQSQREVMKWQRGRRIPRMLLAASRRSLTKAEESCSTPSSGFSIEDDGGGSERSECHATALNLRKDYILCSRSFLALA
jgi:hypothetical protein